VTEEQKTALAEALDAAHVIDADIVYLPQLAEAVDAGQSAEDAVRGLKAQIPGLFRIVDWQEKSEKTPDLYDQDDVAFRASLRKARDPIPNAFATLDAALLSKDELESLTRYVGGQGDNSFDRSVLTAAMHRQTKLLNGDG
jgi:hypothetical protein